MSPLNTDRPTKQIVLGETKKIVVVKEWISGRESEEIDKPVQEAIDIKPGERGEMIFGKVDPTKVVESTHKAIELIVISVDGKTDDILNTVRDLPVKDYNQILTYVNSLSGVKKNP